LAMVDDEFADLEAAGLREYWNEAMQFAVEPHFLEHFRSIRLHPAVVVVQPHTSDRPDHGVKKTARPHFVPRIMANLLPAADHVEPFAKRGEKVGDLVWVVLQVGVECHDRLAERGLESGGEGGGLAEVAAEADAAHPRVAGCQLLDDAPRAV